MVLFDKVGENKYNGYSYVQKLNKDVERWLW